MCMYVLREITEDKDAEIKKNVECHKVFLEVKTDNNLKSMKEWECKGLGQIFFVRLKFQSFYSHYVLDHLYTIPSFAIVC